MSLCEVDDVDHVEQRADCRGRFWPVFELALDGEVCLYAGSVGRGDAALFLSPLLDVQ